MTAPAFSFSEAATRGVLWKNVFLKFRKIYRKTLCFEKFSGTPFLQNTSATATYVYSKIIDILGFCH